MNQVVLCSNKQFLKMVRGRGVPFPISVVVSMFTPNVHIHLIHNIRRSFTALLPLLLIICLYHCTMYFHIISANYFVEVLPE